jgi:hypothetical protein
VTALHAGDRVWVGAPASATPGRILSVHRRVGGRVEYIVRTLDLAGKPGENLNLRVRESTALELVRPRGLGELVEAPRTEACGHVLD